MVLRPSQQLRAVSAGLIAIAWGASIAGCDEKKSPPPPAQAPSAAPPERASAAAPSASAAPPTTRGGPMVRLAAGTYTMGSQRIRDEQPPHKVTVAAFELDKTEVTVAAYKDCVTDGKCTAPLAGPPKGLDANGRLPLLACNWDKPDRAEDPVNCVTWAQSDAYCAWAGKRLPTEEEWEYAAGGVAGRRYPWGDAEPTDKTVCWGRFVLGNDKQKGTCAVGSRPDGATPEGILDLSGNVYEWTSSGYSNDYKSPRSDAKIAIRGESWRGIEPMWVRAAYRTSSARGDAVDMIGFRCARSL